jgi:hypothetical protein
VTGRQPWRIATAQVKAETLLDFFSGSIGISQKYKQFNAGWLP